MKHTEEAVRELMGIVIELADIVRDLDPGRVETYSRLEDMFVRVRELLSEDEAS